MADEKTVIIIERIPPQERRSRTAVLPLGLDARDTCGDGTNEFRHISPLVVWKNLPAPYYIDVSVPENLVDGIVNSFGVWNTTAGFELYTRTTNQTNARITIKHEVIDQQGGILAQAQWSYSESRGEMTRATITFDSRENWSLLTNESCGSNGSIFDIMNVAVHEIGHVSGLGHAPTDRLQTMYASTGPGTTVGRTLGNGDILGFQQAYDITNPPPPCPVGQHRENGICVPDTPTCHPGQHLENGICVPDTPPPPPPSVTKPKVIVISGTTYLNIAYENISGQFLPIKTLQNTQSLPFGGPNAKIVTISGKSYVYLYYYRAANVFTTMGRTPLQ